MNTQKTPEPKLKDDGNQVMRQYLVFLEPELAALLARTGRLLGRTRSTQIRMLLKDRFRSQCRSVDGIDWSEV